MPASPSPAQSAASRTNGAQSHGPATPAGQGIAARNATRWNLTGPFRLLPGEDAGQFQAIRAAYNARLVPQDAAEEHWLDEIVAAIWRQRRLREVEAALHAATMAGWDLGRMSLPSYDSVARYRSRLERDLRLAQAQLTMLRETRPQGAKGPTGQDATAVQLAYLLQLRLKQEAAKAAKPAAANDAAKAPAAAAPATRTIEPEPPAPAPAPAMPEWLRRAAEG